MTGRDVSPGQGSDRRVWLTIVTWAMAAVALGLLSPFERLPLPAVQIITTILTMASLALLRAVPRARAWAASVDLRWLVAVHLTRFVGFYFLFLHARGRLPYAFAVPGGWGDNLVAALALVLLVTPGSGRWRRPALISWNVLGLVDILAVIGTATRLGLTDPGSMRELTRFPLDLLPLLILPWILVSHTVMLWRLGWAHAPVASKH